MKIVRTIRAINWCQHTNFGCSVHMHVIILHNFW